MTVPSRLPSWFIRWLRRSVPAAVALLSGLTTYAAFPPMNLWWSALIGVGTFMLLIRGRGFWAGTSLGLLYGFGLFTPLLHFTMVGMGNPIGWIALTLFESLYLAGLGGAWALVSRLPWLQVSSKRSSSGGRNRLRRVPAGARSVLAFALLWSGVEELRSVWPLGGFPFGRLAFAMADAPVLPAAAYVGSAGVGLLVALVAGCVAHAARSIYDRRGVPVVASVVVGACLLIGPQALPLDARAQNGTVRVGAVQGNVATDFEDAFNRALEVTGNHATATRKLAADVGPGNLDMVIWPENSADLDPRDYPASATIVDEAAQAVRAPVLVGAVPIVGDIRYNDVLVWNPGDTAGKTHASYRKHLPVPFAEYIPARSLVRRLTTQVDRVGIDMLPGNGPSTLTVPAVTQGREVTFAMGICFEVAYDDALRAGVKQGGQAIVIPTNNASFLDSGEAAQQLAQGRVQAVVHGRSVVQASTVGYTAIINARGEVEQVTRPYTQASLVADVPLRSSQTVADRLGAAPGIVILAGAGLLLGAGILSRVRPGRKTAVTAGDHGHRN